MLLMDLIHSIPSRIFNVILAVLMCVGGLYFFSHAGDIANEYSADKSDIEFYILSSTVVGFFFISRFESVFGRFLKALAYVVAGSFVLYITADLQDETALLIVRVVVGLVMAFGIYAFVSFAYLENKEEDLRKNGWKLDTKYQKTSLAFGGDNNSWYVIKTVGRDPSSGEELFFKSDAIGYNPADKIVDDQVFVVYVDKKNPKRYYFDEEPLEQLRPGF